MSGGKISGAHRAEAALVQGLIRLLGSLPPIRAAQLGKAVAGRIGPLISASKTADKNLQFAMPECSAAARKQIIREVWENLGQTMAELVCLKKIKEVPEGAAGPGYSLSGWDEHVAPLIEPGKPLLFFTGHLANWEVMPLMAETKGVEFGFMYRAASNQLVDEMLRQLRQGAYGRKVSMFPKGASGARAAYAHLRQGHALGLLVDQKLDTGVSAPFFGKPAMTMDALASFALKFRCPVLPVHVMRLGPARLRVVCEPPLAVPQSGDKQADMYDLVCAMNETVEGWVRQRPGEWLWLHRRWPRGTV